MFRGKVILTAGLAVLAMGGALMTSAPAEAGPRSAAWRNGVVSGPRVIANYSGYRPARYGYRGGYYRRNNGGAIAAGLIGGLALGALASAPAYSYPAYSYPAYSYPNYPYQAYPASYPGYYGTGYYAGPTCYTVPRRFVDPWGRVFVRRTRVCE
jgi:hypothetical protein